METDSNTPKTEREKYVANLEEKLRKSGRAKRFLDSEDGSLITEYLTERVNAIVQQIGGTKFLEDHNGYVYQTGRLSMARELLVMLNKEASTDTDSMRESLKLAKEDE